MSLQDTIMEYGWIVILAVILLALFQFFGPAVFTAEEKTRETLYAAGYTDPTITGVHYLACSDDDFYRTGFEATNPQGVRVQGTVCCGIIFKGCTIRY